MDLNDRQLLVLFLIVSIIMVALILFDTNQQDQNNYNKYINNTTQNTTHSEKIKIAIDVCKDAPKGQTVFISGAVIMFIPFDNTDACVDNLINR